MKRAEHRTLVQAIVLEVNDVSVLYPSCIQCYAKMLHDVQTNGWQCMRCNTSCSEADLTWRYRLSISVADSSASCNLSLFGGTLVQHFGCSANQFHWFTSGHQGNRQRLGDHTVLKALQTVFVGNEYIFCLKTSAPVQGSNVGLHTLPSHPGIFKSLCLADVLNTSPSSSIHNGKLSDFVAVQMLRPKFQDFSQFQTVIGVLSRIVNKSENNSSLCSISPHQEIGQEKMNPWKRSRSGNSCDFRSKKRQSQANQSSCQHMKCTIPCSVRKTQNCAAAADHFCEHSLIEKSSTSQLSAMFSCQSSMDAAFPLSLTCSDSKRGESLECHFISFKDLSPRYRRSQNNCTFNDTTLCSKILCGFCTASKEEIYSSKEECQFCNSEDTVTEESHTQPVIAEDATTEDQTILVDFRPELSALGLASPICKCETFCDDLASHRGNISLSHIHAGSRSEKVSFSTSLNDSSLLLADYGMKESLAETIICDKLDWEEQEVAPFEGTYIKANQSRGGTNYRPKTVTDFEITELIDTVEAETNEKQSTVSYDPNIDMPDSEDLSLFLNAMVGEIAAAKGTGEYLCTTSQQQKLVDNLQGIPNHRWKLTSHDNERQIISLCKRNSTKLLKICGGSPQRGTGVILLEENCHLTSTPVNKLIARVTKTKSARHITRISRKSKDNKMISKEEDNNNISSVSVLDEAFSSEIMPDTPHRGKPMPRCVFKALPGFLTAPAVFQEQFRNAGKRICQVKQYASHTYTFPVHTATDRLCSFERFSETNLDDCSPFHHVSENTKSTPTRKDTCTTNEVTRNVSLEEIKEDVSLESAQINCPEGRMSVSKHGLRSPTSFTSHYAKLHSQTVKKRRFTPQKLPEGNGFVKMAGSPALLNGSAELFSQGTDLVDNNIEADACKAKPEELFVLENTSVTQCPNIKKIKANDTKSTSFLPPTQSQQSLFSDCGQKSDMSTFSLYFQCNTASVGMHEELDHTSSLFFRKVDGSNPANLQVRFSSQNQMNSIRGMDCKWDKQPEAKFRLPLGTEITALETPLRSCLRVVQPVLNQLKTGRSHNTDLNGVIKSSEQNATPIRWRSDKVQKKTPVQKNQLQNKVIAVPYHFSLTYRFQEDFGSQELFSPILVQQNKAEAPQMPILVTASRKRMSGTEASNHVVQEGGTLRLSTDCASDGCRSPSLFDSSDVLFDESENIFDDITDVTPKLNARFPGYCVRRVNEFSLRKDMNKVSGQSETKLANNLDTYDFSTAISSPDLFSP